MLSKVFKYDIRALKKPIISFVIALLGAGVVGCGVQLFINSFSETADGFGFVGLYGLWLLCVLAVFGLSAAAAILIFYRFYRSIFTDEGYLTMTLPVGTHALLLGKMFAAALLLFGVILAFGIAYLFVFILPDLFYMLQMGWLDGLYDELLTMLPSCDFGDLSVSVLYFLALLASAVKALVLLFAAITLGATALKKAKLLGAFLFVFLISFADGILSTFTLLIPSISANDAAEYGIDICLSLLVAAAFYFLTHFLLRRCFNIE